MRINTVRPLLHTFVDGGPDGSRNTGYHFTVGLENWSKLLDAAIDNRTDELETLIDQVSVPDIISSLQILQRNIEISKKYGISYQETGNLICQGDTGYFYDPESKGSIRFFDAYPAEPATSPVGLQKGQANLLLALPRSKFEMLPINGTKKKIMETQLVQKVSECKNITEIKNFFSRYKHVLSHKRIDFFRPNDYSNLAKGFIRAAQERAVSLYNNKGGKISLSDFLSMNYVIFSKTHLQKNFETDYHRNFWIPFLKSEQSKNDADKISLRDFMQTQENKSNSI